MYATELWEIMLDQASDAEKATLFALALRCFGPDADPYVATKPASVDLSNYAGGGF